MHTQDLTLVLALDRPHLRELALSWPTWMKHWPEIAELPLLIFCDAEQPDGWWRRQIGQVITHPRATLVCWPRAPGADHRERMLSAFVYGTAAYCETPYYWKLDTDCACVRRDEKFAPSEWLTDYVLTSNPWGYTKPAERHERVVEWAKGRPEFEGLTEAPGKRRGGKMKHGRIISYCMFGQTEFAREVAGMCLEHGPVVPGGSQDGILWYCAHRLGRPYKREKMDRYGWRHSRRRLERYYHEAMGGQEEEEEKL